MLHSIERKTLFTFCLAVTLVLLVSWAILQNAPSAASMSGVAARFREEFAYLQRARAALSRAELADQADRLTTDQRLLRIKASALADVVAALNRHDQLAAATVPASRDDGRYRLPDLGTIDLPAIQRLIDVREADDTDYLRAAAANWERKALRFNATVLFASAICVIAMIGALSVALLREVALRRERETADAEARTRLANIMDTLPSAFLSVDDHLRITWANGQAAKLLAKDAARIIGRSLAVTLPREIVEQVARRCAEVLRARSPQDFDCFDADSGVWLAVEVSPSPYGVSIHMRDVSESRRALETQDRLLALLEATPDVVGIQDDRGTCYFNRAGRELFGMGQPTDALTHPDRQTVPDDVTAIPEDVFPIGLERGVYRSEKTIRAQDGRQVPVSQVAIAHRNRTGSVAFVSTILRDISARKRVEGELQDQVRLVESYSRQLEEANARLRALATTDGLTGVQNHRAFQERLAEEFQRAVRYDRPLSIVMIDVDSFKQYNDTFGHPAGDVVLKRVASALQSCARATDTVARYGGEEFVVILPETDAAGAAEAAERMRRMIEGIPWEKRPVTVSVGISTTETEIDSTAELVEAADRALYMSKSRGRNRVTHAAELTEILADDHPLALVDMRQVA
jgi:diguanylate cyclase (GGDEF)-like protein/PAS domain S-box-containing protein